MNNASAVYVFVCWLATGAMPRAERHSRRGVTVSHGPSFVLDELFRPCLKHPAALDPCAVTPVRYSNQSIGRPDRKPTPKRLVQSVSGSKS
jgi:hypothetical protein